MTPNVNFLNQECAFNRLEQGCKKSSTFLTPEFYDLNLPTFSGNNNPYFGSDSCDCVIYDLFIQIHHSLFKERHSDHFFLQSCYNLGLQSVILSHKSPIASSLESLVQYIKTLDEQTDGTS